MINLTRHLPRLSPSSILGAKFECVAEICTDSRQYQSGEIFWGLVGENFDGFQYAEKVISAGAKVLVFQNTATNNELAKKLSTQYPNLQFIGFHDSLKALQELSHLNRNEWYRPEKHIIGITGSNGKTTTKEMLYFLLNGIFPQKVSMTKGNLNNHIGVPLTLCALKSEQEIAIVEMGTSGFKEISFLCDLALPTSGIITNIGSGHIEFFKTQEMILNEKRALMDSVLRSEEIGHFILNENDQFLRTLLNPSKSKQRVFSSKLCSLKEESFTLKFDGEEVLIENKGVYGLHLQTNLALCLFLCLNLFPDKKAKLYELARVVTLPKNNRAEWHLENSPRYFLDAYNANPHSMKASLETFISKMKQQKIDLNKCCFILGDMNELGDLAPAYHREIGQFVGTQNLGKILFVGRYREYYLEGCPAAQSFATKVELSKWLEEHVKEYESFFIKGSRSLQLESIVAHFS